jgi:glucose/arabinose dehydrogenase
VRRRARNPYGMRRSLPTALFLAAVTTAAALIVAVGPHPGAADAETHSARAAAPPAVDLQTVPGSFDQPLYLTAPPGDVTRLFVVEKTGRIRIVKNGAVVARPFLDLSGSVSTDGERGLLSMAFHPRYSSNGRFYVDYTNKAGDTRVVRYTVSKTDPDRADTSTRKVLLRVHQPYSNHNGGQLQFGPDGRLYIGMGDGGSAGDPQGRAQNPRSRLGKLLRIDLSRSPVRVTRYARGVRNPWRFSFDRATGALWIGDVGQNAWEEVDYLRPGRPAGANLGWNGFEGRHVYNRATASRLNRSRLVWPVTEYGHSVGEAVTGGYVYRGSAIQALRGFYVFGDFTSGRVWAMKGPAGARRALAGADRATTHIASFGQDAAGELYVVSLDGSVFKIVPVP